MKDLNKYQTSLNEYIEHHINEKHKTCTQNDFDNGYFWAMKDLQQFLNASLDSSDDTLHTPSEH